MTSETTEKIAQDNNLSTDEILSIVKKNQKKFSKETTISGKISNLFKRQPLKELALDPNIEKSKNDELNENNSADELDSIEKDIKSEKIPKQKNIKNKIAIRMKKSSYLARRKTIPDF